MAAERTRPGEHFYIYVDDSGDEKNGALFSAVVVSAERWRETLGYWLGLRQQLAADYGLPTFFEIHSVGFLSARTLKELTKNYERRETIMNAPTDQDAVLHGVALARAGIELADLQLTRAIEAAHAAERSIQNIATAARMAQQDVESRIAHHRREPSVLSEIACLQAGQSARSKRTKIFQLCVDQLRQTAGLKICTVTTSESSGEARAALYGHLLATIDAWLAGQDAWGSVFVDGSPSARTLYYRDAHRALEIATRRILEDEVVRESSESQFIQMADIIAYCAHRARQGQTGHYVCMGASMITPTQTPVTATDLGFFPLPL
jgi:hypothetical protein